jgi:hypothetical protein
MQDEAKTGIESASSETVSAGQYRIRHDTLHEARNGSSVLLFFWMLWGWFCFINTGGGAFIDMMGDYRYLYLWDAVFTAGSLVFMLLVYRAWKRLGGATAYVAPD